MISRVAEGCFWLTRYLERLDTLARVLGVRHAAHIDAGLPWSWRWRPVVEMAGQTEDFRARVGARSLNNGEAVQHYLTWDESHPSSLSSGLRHTRENARAVREIMSAEAWEAINDLWLWFRSREARRLFQRDRSAFYERVTRSAVLFHGVAHASMLHDEPFVFMKLGRATERVGQTARIMAAHLEEVDGEDDAAVCVAVLRSCCAFDPFFRAGRPLTRRHVVRFLVFDRTLPRSVLNNLDEVRRLSVVLRREDPLGLPRRSREALERLRGELLQMDITDMERRGMKHTLAWVLAANDSLCESIHDDYLDPPTTWLRHCVRVLETVGRDVARGQAA